MSVSSERSCSSPISSATSSSETNSAAIKLKRRWIEMNHLDEEYTTPTSTRLPIDLSVKKARLSVIRTPQKLMEEVARASLQPRVILPEDPRSWTKRDVQIWLKYMTSTYDLEVSPDKFNMNGKALCMMSMEMFAKRVPTGGKFLYKDFRLRLHRAVFFQEKPKPDYSKLSPLQMLTLTAGKYFSGV